MTSIAPTHNFLQRLKKLLKTTQAFQNLPESYNSKKSIHSAITMIDEVFHTPTNTNNPHISAHPENNPILSNTVLSSTNCIVQYSINILIYRIWHGDSTYCMFSCHLWATELFSGAHVTIYCALIGWKICC